MFLTKLSRIYEVRSAIFKYEIRSVIYEIEQPTFCVVFPAKAGIQNY